MSRSFTGVNTFSGVGGIQTFGKEILVVDTSR